MAHEDPTVRPADNYEGDPAFSFALGSPVRRPRLGVARVRGERAGQGVGADERHARAEPGPRRAAVARVADAPGSACAGRRRARARAPGSPRWWARVL